MKRPSVPVVCASIAAVLSIAGAAAAPPSIVYTTKKVERRDPACTAQADAWTCAHITFTYPVIERAPRLATAAAINRAVTDFLLTMIGQPRRLPSIDAAMVEFMTGYEEYRRGGGTAAGYWEERTVTIPYQSPRTVSLSFALSFFTGGLHPQYAHSFTSFDAMTGAKITLADVLVPGYAPRLTRIAENKFRAIKGIKPGTTLHDAGYIFFKNDTFALNDNFWIGPAGITFFYNAYEIAPYAMGPTELPLTYAEIRELIRPGGLLGSMRL